MPLEEVGFELDPRSVVGAVGQMNRAMEGFEKGASGAGQRLSDSWKRVSDQMVKLVDKQYDANLRLVRSIENQAAAYGRSGIERLIAQRDQHIKRLGDEEGLIKRVTAAYDKMIEKERAGGERTPVREAFLGSKDVFEGRNAYGIVEFAKGLGELKGAPALIGAAAGALVGLAVAGFEATKSVAEYGVRIRDVELRTGLAAKEVGQFSFAARAVGQDVSFVERAMRGLTDVLTEETAAGDKARQSLMGRLGVRPFDLEGNLKPTAEILTEISEGFNRIPGAIERNRVGMDIFKRQWLEIGPAVLELSENVKRAKELGLGPEDSDVKRFVEYNRKIAEAGALWEQFWIKVKGGFAAGFVATVEALTPPAGREIQGPRMSAGRQVTRENAEILDQVSSFLAGRGRAAGEVAGAAGAQELRSYLGRSDSLAAAQQNLTKLKQAYEEARINAQKLADSGMILPRVADEQRRKVEGALEAYRRQSDVVKELEKDESRRIASLEKARDLIREGQSFYKIPGATGDVFVTGEDIAKANQVRRRPTLVQAGEYNPFASVQASLGMQETPLKEGLQVLGGQAVFVSPESARQGGIGQTPFGEEVFDPKRMEEWWKRATEMRTRDQQIAMSGIETQASATERLLELRTGPGGELETARVVAGVRQKALEDEFAITGDVARLREGSLRNELELRVREAEIQRQQTNEIKQETQGLLHTLFTRPREFGSQLSQRVRDAALKPIEERLSSAFANFLQPRLFGSGDPHTVAVDRNTVAINNLTAAVTGVPASVGGTGLPGLPGGGSLPIPGVLGSGGWGSLIPGIGGPGGTTGYNGPVGGGFGGLGSILRGGLGTSVAMGGGGTAAALGGMAGLLGGSMLLGGGLRQQNAAAGGIMSAGGGALLGMQASQLLGATPLWSGVFGAGIGLGAAGLMHGGWSGVGMTTAGGALVGLQLGGPIGAAIGAGVGFVAGMIRMGFESPEQEAIRLVKQIYSITIDRGMARQIVQIAKDKYAGHVSIAVRAPEVRDMLMLYAAGTGQKLPMSAQTPHGVSTAEIGGKLYQAPTYQFGNPFVQPSSLPTMGGGAGVGQYPVQQISLHISGQDVAGFMTGNYVTPGFVQSQFQAAQQGSDGRMNNAITLLQPNLLRA